MKLDKNSPKIFSGKVAFELYDIHGLPLEIIFDEIIKENNFSIDWEEFILTARKQKWNWEKIINSIGYNLDKAPTEFWDRLYLLCKKMIEKEEKNKEKEKWYDLYSIDKVVSSNLDLNSLRNIS